MNTIILIVFFASNVLCTENAANISISNRVSPLHIQTFLNEANHLMGDAALLWNSVAIQAAANDYNKEIISIPDKRGPTATSRAFAIVHGAMLNGMNEYIRIFDDSMRRQNGSGLSLIYRRHGIHSAVAEAAFRTLIAMYPKQHTFFVNVHDTYFARLRSSCASNVEINMGLTAGQIMAKVMLYSRENDGSNNQTQYVFSMGLGYHRPDPTRPDQGVTDPHWGNVKPFVLDSVLPFRAASVIGNTTANRARYLASTDYANELEEVKSIGSKSSIYRTDEQTWIGIAWAYDGAPAIGTPPRLYNQVVRAVMQVRPGSTESYVRLLALVNYAMADAAIAAWNTKYFYNYWRPIVGIRQSDNFAHVDPTWLPLGAPADGEGADFTPGFPAYVSGHASFGSSVFECLRSFYGTEWVNFQFSSDEYNGKTRDSSTGRIRPQRGPRYYNSFTQAENENADSRIYLGVHWRSDVTRGRILGRAVAAEVYRKLSLTEY